MIFIFFVLTLIHIPVMMSYSSYNTYQNETADKTFKTLSLGNMGFASSRCVHTGMAVEKIILSCKTGHISKFLDFGFIAANEERNVCLMDHTKGFCTQSFNRTNLSSYLNKTCTDYKNCTLNGLKSYLSGPNKNSCQHRDSQFFV